ncbi:MAG: glycosyltransferase family 2 protein [Ginsengibacter sp.]
MIHVSVITINYNNLGGLEKTMPSVINQGYAHVEYIVIDGGSHDGSKAFIEKNKEALSYWVSEKDKGVYHAMNKGIEKASGDYLLFLNSGDYLLYNNCIEKIFSTGPTADILFGNLLTSRGEIIYPDKPGFTFFFRDSVGHPASFIRKTLFNKYGMYNEAYSIISDWEFFLKVIIKHKVAVHHIKEAITYYDISGMSNNPANIVKQLQERSEVLGEYFPVYYNEVLESFNDMEKELNNYKNSRAIGLLQTVMKTGFYKSLLGKK